MSTLVHSVTVVSGGEVTPDAWVRFSGDAVSDRGVGDTWRDREASEVIDAAGSILTPGFIDVHGHGGAGGAFDEGVDAARAALALHRGHGTTRSVLSLVTAGIDDLVARVEALAPLVHDDPLVLGIHLEGPFLADSHRGAHLPELLRSPEEPDVDRLLAAAEGTLAQVTLAPELPGAAAAIRRFTAAGVRVAVGHTGVDFAGARQAFEQGASILTHAFNGMPGIHHREPGPVLAAMRSTGVTVEIIADGVHVHPEVVALLFECVPERITLITDAMAATGSPDGDYWLGPNRVTVRDGVARTAGGSLAGSTLTQDKALRVAVQQAGVPLEVAVTALTLTPARCLGLDGWLGRLDPGYAADAVLLDQALGVRAVWAQGRRHL